ncbi:MAG: hypothetical protein R2831_07250 [Chitinophagaceae bacterium]
MNLFNKQQNQKIDDTLKIKLLFETSEQALSKHKNLFLSKSLDFVFEYLFYLCGLACFVFMFLMTRIFPFYVLSEIELSKHVISTFSNQGDVELFCFAVKAMVGLIGILFIMLGFSYQKARKLKDILTTSRQALTTIKKELETPYQNLPQAHQTESNSDVLTRIEPKEFNELP